ncbi:MAG TPA: helix-turn-helix transcriptional regulator [Thermoanaerobaculia bacterium]|jgi:transcriptional regulator with XRE-family HTH domain|nr:helix-turn-helix transcriptional regulator [Thermoanaerobaculia bacterium]
MQPRLNVYNGLGLALRRLREKTAGLTQIEVAARSGIAQSRLSRYENGRKLPDLITLDRLLSCYGVDSEGLGRAVKEAQGAVPVPASDPELMARVREALAELGYSKPSSPPDS